MSPEEYEKLKAQAWLNAGNSQEGVEEFMHRFPAHKLGVEKDLVKLFSIHQETLQSRRLPDLTRTVTRSAVFLDAEGFQYEFSHLWSDQDRKCGWFEATTLKAPDARRRRQIEKLVREELKEKDT